MYFLGIENDIEVLFYYSNEAKNGSHYIFKNLKKGTIKSLTGKTLTKRNYPIRVDGATVETFKSFLQ